MKNRISKNFIFLLAALALAFGTSALVGCGGGSGMDGNQLDGSNTFSGGTVTSPDDKGDDGKTDDKTEEPKLVGAIPMQYSLEQSHQEFAKLIDPSNPQIIEDVRKAYDKYFPEKDIVHDPSGVQGDPQLYLNVFFRFVMEASSGMYGKSEFRLKHLFPLGTANREAKENLLSNNIADLSTFSINLADMVEETEWLANFLFQAATIYKVPLKKVGDPLPNDFALRALYFAAGPLDIIKQHFYSAYGNDPVYKQMVAVIGERLVKIFRNVNFSVVDGDGKTVYLSFIWFEDISGIDCSKIPYQCLQRGLYGAFLPNLNVFHKP